MPAHLLQQEHGESRTLVRHVKLIQLPGIGHLRVPGLHHVLHQVHVAAKKPVAPRDDGALQRLQMLVHRCFVAEVASLVLERNLEQEFRDVPCLAIERGDFEDEVTFSFRDTRAELQDQLEVGTIRGVEWRRSASWDAREAPATVLKTDVHRGLVVLVAWNREVEVGAAVIDNQAPDNE